jgi:hypothetical protein
VNYLFQTFLHTNRKLVDKKLAKVSVVDDALVTEMLELFNSWYHTMWKRDKKGNKKAFLRYKPRKRISNYTRSRNGRSIPAANISVNKNSSKGMIASHDVSPKTGVNKFVMRKWLIKLLQEI